MISFDCLQKTDNHMDFWYGSIQSVRGNKNLVEIQIISRSSITVMIGRAVRGYFACMPDFYASCYLGNLDNVSYNTDKLTRAMKNPIDALTVAKALKTLNEKIDFN